MNLDAKKYKEALKLLHDAVGEGGAFVVGVASRDLMIAENAQVHAHGNQVAIFGLHHALGMFVEARASESIT